MTLKGVVVRGGSRAKGASVNGGATPDAQGLPALFQRLQSPSTGDKVCTGRKAGAIDGTPFEGGGPIRIESSCP